MTKTMTRWGAAAFVAALLFVGAVAAQAYGEWFQGFESDTAGWFDSNEAGWDGYGYITQVASGNDSIASADGSFHAVAEGYGGSSPYGAYYDDMGSFSRFDGYRDTWPGEWIAEVAVYLDPSWASGTGFDYSVAANGSDGNHQRDYIFHVTKDSSTGDLMVAGSNNSNFAPREDLENSNHYVVPAAGWYTLQHRFYDDGGILSVDLNVVDGSDTVVFTETRSDVSDTIPAEVGGNRYAWFTFINVPDGIAVDNHQLNIGEFVRSLEITSPDTGSVNFGDVELGAVLTDDDTEDDAQWAVRAGTCVAGTDTVAGNVDGFSDDYDWDGETFSALWDTSDDETGVYCFVFNPTENDGEEDLRVTREFYLGELSVTPAEAYNPVDTEHTVTASIGVPVAGVDVTFNVAGVHSNADVVATDASGEAAFTYIGDTGPGIDTITTCVDEGVECVEVVKYWYDGMISGGGQILEETGNKKKDWHKISFGGESYNLGSEGILGDWQVNFHNTGVDEVDGGKFHGSDYAEFVVLSGNTDTCEAASRIQVLGTFNGEEGYRLVVRAGDSNLPASTDHPYDDTIRFELYGPSGLLYDTTESWGGEFADESSCHGTARTGVDNGNITIVE